jgi:hypothetical protein
MLAVKLTVRFRLPSCVGLGSSGAYCVCIATSLLQSSGLIPAPTIVVDSAGESVLTWQDPHLDMIRKWAAAAESLIHGRASGIDAAVCTYGKYGRGMRAYTTGGILTFSPDTNGNSHHPHTPHACGLISARLWVVGGDHMIAACPSIQPDCSCLGTRRT